MQYIQNDLKQAVKERLNQDKGLQVFQYYGFEPNNRKPQRENPFRQERTPSFFINWYNGAFRFKDFGDSESQGNAWEFLKRMEGLQDNALVWQRLAEIYNLAYPNTRRSTFNAQRSTLNTQRSTLNTQRSTLQNITFRDFTQEELEFWWKKGEIDLPTLQAENVQAVESFEILYEKEGGKNRVYRKNNIRFVFAFEIAAGKCYKLYQPKELYRAFGKGKTTFLPNLSHAKEAFGEDYRYTFGLESLTLTPSKLEEKSLLPPIRVGEGETILCGGEADCLALKAKGYNAFTLGSEEAKIPPYALRKLAGKGIDTKNLRVLYDTDFTGYKHSQLLKERYKMPVLTLPKLALQKEKHLPKPIENDLCDYIGKFGWDSDLELCLAQKSYSKRGFVLPAVPQFKVQKYLKEYAGHLVAFFLQNKKVQLVGDAGLGKTHTLLREVALQMPNPVLFLVPYTIQVSQIEKEYADLGHELTCFHNKPPQEDEEMRFGQINVCTYDRAIHLFEKNPMMEIWVDESHLLTQAYPYRKQAIDNILAMAGKTTRVVLLSATPDYQYARYEDYKPIVFQRAINPKFTITPKTYHGKNEKEALLGELLEAKKVKGNETTNGITVVRLNDKKLAKSCSDALIKGGHYKKNEIDFVFSMEEKDFATPAHQAIINTGLIPEGVKLLFVSSFFDCGINVYNRNVKHLILFETQVYDNQIDIAIQVSQRFRNLEALAITIAKPARKNALPDALQSTFKREKNNYNMAKARLDYILSADASYQEKNRYFLQKKINISYLKLNPDLSKGFQMLRWDKEKNTFAINENYLRYANQTFLQEHLGEAEYYALLLNELPHAKLVEKGEEKKEEEKETQTEEFITLLKEAKEAQKKKACETREQLLPQLEEAHCKQFFERGYAQSKDIALKQNILTQTMASLPDIQAQCQYQPIPASADIEGAFETSAKQQLIRQYLQLKNLLLPEDHIRTLLKTQQNAYDFATMLKTLGNHIKLKACEQLGEDVQLLAQDAIMREEIRTLQFLRNELVKLPKANPKEQKKSAQYARQLHSIAGKLQNLANEKKALEKNLESMVSQPKTKTAQEKLKRKIASKQKQIEKGYARQTKVEETLQESYIHAWEVNELNGYLNTLQGKGQSMQMRVHLRLVESLCHTHTFRKKTWDETTQTYEPKQYIAIQGLKTFEEALEGFGLPAHEAKRYTDALAYQMTADVQRIRQEAQASFLSKTTEKVHEASIVYYLQPKNVIENEKGYPESWD